LWDILPASPWNEHRESGLPFPVQFHRFFEDDTMQRFAASTVRFFSQLKHAYLRSEGQLIKWIAS
jgi:hypothetical protein